MDTKHYVCVTANIDLDGSIKPVSVEFDDGYTAIINRVWGVIRTSSFKRLGGAETRYSISIGKRLYYLYIEDKTDKNSRPRWYIEFID